MDCPFCSDEYSHRPMTWCRVCHKWVCERAREYQERRPGQSYWVCENPSWCTHGGYAKKCRFSITSDQGNYRFQDDETGAWCEYDNSMRKEYAILNVLNQLAFELDMLKQQLVKDTE